MLEVSDILNEEFTFLMALFADPVETEQEETPTGEGTSVEQEFSKNGGITRSETKTGPNSNCMTDNTSTYFFDERGAESAQPLIV